MSQITEICVVFTKNVPLAEAVSFLSALALPSREGSNSSRGRLYFESTGPKFILTLDRADLEAFIATLSAQPIVHEAYQANFEIFKD